MATCLPTQEPIEQDRRISALLRLLWGQPNREFGYPIEDLPIPLRNEVLLTLCAGKGLVEFGELRVIAGPTCEEYWHRHNFKTNEPYSPFLQAALAGNAPVRDGSVIAPGLIRLTANGEMAACSLLSEAESTAYVKTSTHDEQQAYDDEQQGIIPEKRFTHKPWPGSAEWHNWGVGLDAKDHWHLFHFQRWGDARGIYRWARHHHACVRIAQGKMERLARTFAMGGRVSAVDANELRQVTATMSRLRAAIRSAIKAEGHAPKGNPIQFRARERSWRAVVSFGTVTTNERRHLIFWPADARSA